MMKESTFLFKKRLDVMQTTRFYCILAFMLGFCSIQRTQAQYIYEVYSAGSLSGSYWATDYIVLGGFSPNQSMTNWTVQYRSASGSSWFPFIFAGNADANGFFRFVAEGPSGTVYPFTNQNTTTLGFNLVNGTAGMLLLVNSTTAVAASPCPTLGVVVKDAVYYISTANTSPSCTLGAHAPATALNQSRRRKTVSGVVQNTGNNANDFELINNPYNPCTTPTAYALTGGGAVCSGGAGVAVGLANSETGVTYQLKDGATNVGSAVSGTTGSAITFGNQTTATTYTVVATRTTGGCTATMTGSAVVTINTSPTAYTVTGTGSFCTGGTGVAVGLSNSETGVTYQLKNGATSVGLPVNGITGSAITFGNQTTAATYTVEATKTTGGCTATMTGSAVVTSNTPIAYTVTGTSAVCPGGTGLAPGLSNSQTGVSYQLKNGATNVGAAVTGTGSSISFGTQSAGTYTVVATSSGCTATMTGNATIATSTGSVPTAYAMTGGGSFCAGGTGVAVGLANSENGVTYRLQNAGSNVGTAVSGTGAAISFPNQTTAATYNVIATTTVGGCVAAMSSNAVVAVNALPTAYNVTGGGAFCAGGMGVVVGVSNSELNISYQLKNGASNVGSSVSGTGSPISFTNKTTAATYTVVATSTGSCTTNMTGNAVVTITPNVASPVFTTGATTLCEGGTSTYTATAANSTSIVYSILNGTGASINSSTGIVSSVTGNFTVVATASGCNGPTTANRAVTVDAKPSITSAASSNSPICPSATLNLSVGAAGAAPLSYAWAGTGTFTNGTTATPSVSGATTGNYMVTVTNSCGTITSTAAVVVNTAPSITSAVSSNSPFCSNTSLTLSVGASGSTLNYAWSGTGTFTNGTTATPSVSGAATGNYTVTVSNSCGNVTSTAAVVANTPPTITSAASSNSPLCPSATINLNVGASGTAPLSYSWFGVGFFSNNYITNPTVTGGITSNYTVTVTNSCGSVTSTAAVTFIPRPNAYNVTGGGVYCQNAVTVPIGLSGTQAGVVYTLYKDGALSGTTMTGNGSAQSIGVTAVGTYTFKIINTSNSCGNTDMGGSRSVTSASVVTPALTIEATPSTTITTGSTITFWVNPTNGGESPDYVWKKNGTTVSTGSSNYLSSSLATNDVISCAMTSSMDCATPETVTSNNLTITVLNSSCNCKPNCSPIPTTAGIYTASVANNADGSTNMTHYCDDAGNLLLSLAFPTLFISNGVPASAVRIKVGDTPASSFARFCGETVNANKCFLSSSTGNALINRWWHIDKVVGSPVSATDPMEVWSYFKASDFTALNTALTGIGGTVLTHHRELKLYQPFAGTTPALGAFPNPSSIKPLTFYLHTGAAAFASTKSHGITTYPANPNNVYFIQFKIPTIVNSGGVGKF